MAKKTSRPRFNPRRCLAAEDTSILGTHRPSYHAGYWYATDRRICVRWYGDPGDYRKTGAIGKRASQLAWTQMAKRAQRPMDDKPRTVPSLKYGKLVRLGLHWFRPRYYRALRDAGCSTFAIRTLRNENAGILYARSGPYEFLVMSVVCDED